MRTPLRTVTRSLDLMVVQSRDKNRVEIAHRVRGLIYLDLGLRFGA